MIHKWPVFLCFFALQTSKVEGEAGGKRQPKLSYHSIYVFAKRISFFSRDERRPNFSFKALKSLTNPCSLQPIILNSAGTCTFIWVGLHAVSSTLTNQDGILLLSKAMQVEARFSKAKTQTFYSSTTGYKCIGKLSRFSLWWNLWYVLFTKYFVPWPGF